MKRIQEIIELMEVTGDKCVILNKEHNAYVIMKLEDYKAFYQNRLGSPRNQKINETMNQRNNESLNQVYSNSPKNFGKIKPIHPKSTNIKEFEIKRPIKIIDEEDIYYTEPLIE